MAATIISRVLRWSTSLGTALIAVAATPSASAWVVDPEPGKVEFDFLTYQETEGSSSDVVVDLRVRRVEGSIGACSVTVNVNTAGTASAGSDYTFTAQTVSWANGDSTAKTVPVTIKHDWIDEPDETVHFFLQSPVGTTVGTNSETVLTILDNDGCVDKAKNPCPCGTAGCFDPNGSLQFVTTRYNGNEDGGSQTDGQIALQIARTGGSNGDITVEFATVSGGTAVAGADYLETVEVVSWSHGDTSLKTVYVTSLFDCLDEPNETIHAVLQNPTGSAVLGHPVNALLTIVDNDLPPVVSVTGNSTVAESNEDALFTVQLSHAFDCPVVVGYSTRSDAPAIYKAAAGEDYVAAEGTLTFEPGETEKPISVRIRDDLDWLCYEGTETFYLDIHEVVTPPLAPVLVVTNPETQISITDNEVSPIPQAVGSAFTYEGTSHSVQLQYRLPYPSVEPVIMSFTLAGIAALNNDYQLLTPSPLIFTPGHTGASLRFMAILDSIDEPMEPIEVMVGDQVNGTVRLADASELAWFEILPGEEVTLGLKSQVLLRAIGRNGRGEEVPASPVWGLDGPGVMTPTGRYLSPEHSAEGQAVAVVTQQGDSAIRGEKVIKLDTRPPRIGDFLINDTTPGDNSITGEATLTWSLIDDVEQESLPVTYVVTLDGRSEIGRISSSDKDSTLLWNSASVADGEHTVIIEAMDQVGNSNVGVEPHVRFVTTNSGAGTAQELVSGLDWLLEHQWRDADADLGSWKSSIQRTDTELVMEAAFAAQTLSGADLSYISRGNNVYSGSPVKVAQAYHDAVVWLGTAWKNDRIIHFVDKAIVYQVLTYANQCRSRLVHHLGSVSKEFDEAVKVATGFGLSQSLQAQQNPDGSLASLEESQGTRYETMDALRSALMSKDSAALETLLRGGNGTASIPLYLESHSSNGGWVNTVQPGDTESNYYLTTHIADTIGLIIKSSASSQLRDKLSSMIGFLQGNQDEEGGFPANSPTVTDTAAGIHALVLARINSIDLTVDTDILGDAVDYLKQEQDYAWNDRSLDTAWALRALRPELSLIKDSIIFEPMEQMLAGSVTNNGAVPTDGNVVVSAFSADPTKMPPRERTRFVLGTTHLSASVEVGGSAEVRIPLNQSVTPSRVYMMIDPEERIAEYEESNNIAVWTLPVLPNLVIYDSSIKATSELGGEPVAGTTWTLTCEVRNLGLTTVPSSDIQAWLYKGNPLDSFESAPLLYQVLPELKAGEAATITFPIYPDRYDLHVPSQHDLYVWVDPESGMGNNIGAIRESDEHDNIAHANVDVYEAGSLERPNLRIVPEGITFTPHPLASGQMGNIRIRVDNIGQGIADPFDIGVATDEFETSRPVTVEALPPGRSAVVSVPFVYDNVDTNQKFLTVTAVADASQRIRESREDDNKATLILPLMHGDSGFDVGLTSADISIAKAPENAFNVSARVWNFGNDMPYDQDRLLTSDLRYFQDQSILESSQESYNDALLRGQSLETVGELGAIGASPNKEIEVVANVTLQNGQNALDINMANNSANRRFFLGNTNLRALALEADNIEISITDPELTHANVQLTATYGNGDGTAMDTAAGAHLEIRNAQSGEVLSYWNNLTIPSHDTETQEHLTFHLSATVNLPVGTHHLQIVLDPNAYFVETDETDNIQDLWITVTDSVSNRLDPDLAAGAVGVKPIWIHNDLYFDISVQNIRRVEDGVASASCPPTLARIYELFEWEEGVTELEVLPNAISEGVDIPALAPGETYRTIVYTGVNRSHISAFTKNFSIHFDDNEVVPEYDESNNWVVVDPFLIASTSGVQAAAVLTQIHVDWQTVPGAAEYKLVRYRSDLTPERTYSLAGTITELVDNDPEIEPETEYKYGVYVLGANGLWSPATYSNVVKTGKLPRIVEVIHGTKSEFPEGQITAFATEENQVQIGFEYEGVGTLELVCNAVPVAHQVADASLTTFTVSLDYILNRYEVHLSQQVNGKTYAGKSNAVVIYHDEQLPDLSYQYLETPTIKPDVHVHIRHSESVMEELLDFGAVEKYRGKDIQVSFKYKNTGSAVNTLPFTSMLEIIFTDDAKVPGETLCNLTGNLGEGLITVQAPNNDASIKEIRLTLDQSSELTGADQIKELSESNNILRLMPSGKQSVSSNGTEFWALYPYSIGELGRWNNAYLNTYLTGNNTPLYPKYDFQLKSASNETADIEIFKIENGVDNFNYMGNTNQVNNVTVPPASNAYWRYPFNSEELITEIIPDAWWLKPDTTATIIKYPSEGPLLKYNDIASDFNLKREWILDGIGVRFEASKDVGMSLLKPSENLQESCMVFPVDQLGSKYIVSSFHHQMEDGINNQYNDEVYKFRSYFQVMAIDDDTTIIIRNNHLGVPNFDKVVNSGLPKYGTIIEDGGAYEINLDKGKTYLWVSNHHYEDPTGVIVESLNDKKIVVNSGSTFLRMPGKGWGDWSSDIHAILPSQDMLGKTYILPKVPENAGVDRASSNDLMSYDAQGAVLGGKFQNHFSRIMALEDTSVTLMPGNLTFQLSKGQWLEVGENAFENLTQSHPHHPLTDPIEVEIYDNLKYGVQRVIDGNDEARIIHSDKDVQVITYLPHIYPENGRSYYSGGKGGPAMIVNAPFSGADSRNLIPIDPLDGSFTNGWQPDGTHTYGRQYLTVMAKIDNGVFPSISFSHNHTNNSWEDIAALSATTHTAVALNDFKKGVSDGWQVIPAATGEQYAYCTFPLTFDDPNNQVYIYNPNHTPLLLRHLGYAYWMGSFGKPAGNWWGKFDPFNYENVLNDLELTPASIRFPYNTSIQEGVPVRARVEVLNNGTEDINLLNQTVTLKVWQTFSEDANEDELIHDGQLQPNQSLEQENLILRKRLAQFPVDFDFTPSRGVTGVRAEIFMDGDGDPLNNKAFRAFQTGFVVRPEFEATSIDADWPLAQYEDLVVTATIRNQEVHVESVPVRWTYGFEGSESVELTEAVFNPDSIIAGGEGYQAQTTVTLQVSAPAGSGEFTVSVEANPDYTLDEMSGNTPANQEGNTATTSTSLEMPMGNLSLAATWVSSLPALTGSQGRTSVTVTNSNVRDYTNIPVVIRAGTSPSARVLVREIIDHIPAGESWSKEFTIAVTRDGSNVYPVTINPDPFEEESTYTDNEVNLAIEAFSTFMPELYLADLLDDFTIPLERARGGSPVVLDSNIKNHGVLPVTDPYKIQVFEGGNAIYSGRVIVESVTGYNELAPQAQNSLYSFTGGWNTTSESLGMHTVHLVIDSPDHLAAPGDSSFVTTRTAMIADRLSSQGIELVNIPDELRNVQWRLKVFSTDTVSGPGGILLGSYNTATTGTGFVREPDSVATQAPVQLQIESATQEPLPIFEGQWQVNLHFLDKQGSPSTGRYTTIRVMLPGNEAGGYGHGTSFWLADDGSTYFTRQLHLVSDFGAIGTEDLLPDESINDLAGAVDEANETNNIIIKPINLIGEGPNLTITGLRVNPAPQITGRSVRIEADVTNLGEALTSQSAIRLQVEKDGTAGSDQILPPDQVIAQALYHQQEVTRTFTWDTDVTSGTYTFTAQVDPDNEIPEANEQDNTTTASLDLYTSTTISVNVQGAGPYDPNGNVDFQVQIESAEDAYALLSLEVATANTLQVVASIDNSDKVPFRLLPDKSFLESWNIGTTRSGDYVIIARLTQLGDYNEAVSELVGISNSFTIEDSRSLSAFVETDKAEYVPGSPIFFTAGLSNISGNHVFETVSASMDIYNSNDQLLWSASELPPVEGIAIGQVRTLQNLFAPAPSTIGNGYKAVWTVFEDQNGNGVRNTGETFDIAEATFDVQEALPELFFVQPPHGSWHKQDTRVIWNSSTPDDVATSEGIHSAIPFVLDELTTVSGPALIDSGDYVTSEGKILVSAWAVDDNDMPGPASSVLFNVDKTSPTVTVNDSTALYGQSPGVEVNGFADDFKGSGISAVLYRMSNEASWTTITTVWPAYTPADPTRMHFDLTIFNEDPQSVPAGSYTIYIKSVDQAGNVSDELELEVPIDTEPPQIDIVAPSQTVKTDEFTIVAQVTDNLSGTDENSIEYQIVDAGALPDPDNWLPMQFQSGSSLSGSYSASDNAWLYSDGNIRIYARGADMAGNNFDTLPADNNPRMTEKMVDLDMPPHVPTGVRAKYTGYGQIRVTWNTNTEHDFSSYRIKRGVLENPNADVIIATGLTNDEVNNFNLYLDSNGIDETELRHYTYSIQAFDNVNNASAWSSPIIVLHPDTPTNLKAIGRVGKVDLSWDPVNDDFIDGYNIYRSTVHEAYGFDFLNPIQVGKNTTSYTDFVSGENEIYYYIVRSRDATCVGFQGSGCVTNESLDSNMVKARTGSSAGPNPVASKISRSHITFEDLTDALGNEWDFNDVGVILEAEAHLDQSDNVTKVVVTAFGKIHESTTMNHEIRLNFYGLQGTASWSRVVSDAKDVGAQYVHSMGSGTIGAGQPGDIPLFDNSHISVPFRHINNVCDSNCTYTLSECEPSPGIEGDKAQITVIINQPHLNPVSSFDEAPFDTYINTFLAGTPHDTRVGIYDESDSKTKIRYYSDRSLIENSPANGRMGGTKLSNGMAIPIIEDWVLPVEGVRFWDLRNYPYFEHLILGIKHQFEGEFRAWYYYFDPCLDEQ